MKETLVLRFRIFGNLRFLSHRETLALFQRALVRTGIDFCYSQGFNPRPRMSLPFPRSVGLQSEDELLYASVLIDKTDCDIEKLGGRIREQLPCGCEIVSVELVDRKKSYRALSAVYEFPVAGLCSDETIKAAVGSLA